MHADTDAPVVASPHKGKSIVPSRGYYRRPSKGEQRVALNFKVPETLKASLLVLQRMWKLRAEVEGATDEEVEAIDLTYLCNELLQAGIDGSWEEVGKLAGLSGAPKDDDEWDALQRALEAQAATRSE